MSHSSRAVSLSPTLYMLADNPDARMEERHHHDLALASGFSEHHLGLGEDDVERDGATSSTSYGAAQTSPRRRASLVGPHDRSPGVGSSEGSPLLGPKPDGRDNVAANINPHGGESSDGQTLFNSIGVLIGIGLLSMPLAFSYAGWIGGAFLVIAFSAVTCHT